MNAMRCEACGHVNAAGSTCEICGAPLPAASHPSVQGVPSPREDEATPPVRDADAAALRAVAERWRAPAPARSEPHYAGGFVRLVAMAIDVAILVIFTLPLATAGIGGVKAGLLALGRPAPAGTEETLTSLFVLAWLAMAMIYFTTLHRGGGQTIGKAMLRIRVRRARDLSPIGIVRSLVRTLGYAVSTSFFGTGFLMVVLTPHKRGWHDYLAGTCVVRLATDEV